MKMQLNRLSKHSKNLSPLQSESFRSTQYQTIKLKHSASSTCFSTKHKTPPPEHFESPYTLQAHSPPSISFTKEQRFRNTSYQHKAEHSGRIWLKNSRSFKFNITKRKELFVINKNPAGSNYHLRPCFDDDLMNSKGFTFSSASSRYSDSKDKKKMPGPGKYTLSPSWYRQNPVQMTSKKFSFYYHCIKNQSTVSPQKYHINYDLTENSRYKRIGFGVGNRLLSSNSITPGVGSYNLPSCFDLFRKMKIPIN